MPADDARRGVGEGGAMSAARDSESQYRKARAALVDVHEDGALSALEDAVSANSETVCMAYCLGGSPTLDAYEALADLADEGWVLTRSTGALREARIPKHRVVLSFDANGVGAKLICPETGCSPPECWIASWFDSCCELTVVIDEAWDLDHMKATIQPVSASTHSQDAGS